MYKSGEIFKHDEFEDEQIIIQDVRMSWKYRKYGTIGGTVFFFPT